MAFRGRNTKFVDVPTGVAGNVLKRSSSNLLMFANNCAYVSKTDTGAQNNYNIGVVGDTFLEWNGGANITITGITGGAAGRILYVRNTDSTEFMFFAQDSGSSSVGNRFANTATSAATPIGPGGHAIYIHNGTTHWILVEHDQGGWLTPAFAAGDFTAFAAGTWTVASGDISSNRVRLAGKSVSWQLSVVTTTVVRSGADPTILVVNYAQSGGFIPTGTVAPHNVTLVSDNGTASAGQIQWNGSNWLFFLMNGGQWANATDATSVKANLTFEVT